MRTRGVWLRGLIAFGIGMTLVVTDSSSKFDLRFQMRGAQDRTLPYVLVYISQEDWSAISGQVRNIIRPLKEITAYTDSFFWNPSTWQQLLGTILNSGPAGVAVTFFFPASATGPALDTGGRNALFDNRVFWAARLDNDGRAMVPAFVGSYGHNAGLIDFYTDDDRSVRRFISPLVHVPHMAVRLAETVTSARGNAAAIFSGDSRMINFQGPEGTFPELSARDILVNPGLARQVLKNKIVIIGTRDLEGHIYTTPVGPLSRAELLANVTDNIIANRWIQRPSFYVIATYLLLVMILGVIIMQTYPQVVALVFLMWLGVAISAGAFWAFDSHYVWLPLLAPLVELFVIYMIFVGYQLTLQEGLNWRLEQEKKYLEEIEKLKNNFVSLFSHDLKTPIAKIQAICDRLMPNAPNPEVQKGLSALRQESTELHRYIQSILRVSRIESRDFRINKEPTDINELIFKVCQQVRPLAEAKQIQLDTNLEPIFSIEVDSDLIQEVILNLVENAIKYSPVNSPVVISSREVGDQVIVTVTDAGPGIPVEEQGKIFDKFYRGIGHVMSTKGSGLGLYLVKYFVELHGGRVFVRSGGGKGTRFGFVLPLDEVQQTLTEIRYDQRA